MSSRQPVCRALVCRVLRLDNENCLLLPELLISSLEASNHLRLQAYEHLKKGLNSNIAITAFTLLLLPSSLVALLSQYGVGCLYPLQALTCSLCVHLMDVLLPLFFQYRKMIGNCTPMLQNP